MSKVDALNVYNYNLKVSLIVDHTVSSFEGTEGTD